jgi:hypothetical protein
MVLSVINMLSYALTFKFLLYSCGFAVLYSILLACCTVIKNKESQLQNFDGCGTGRFCRKNVRRLDSFVYQQ